MIRMVVIVVTIALLSRCFEWNQVLFQLPPRSPLAHPLIRSESLFTSDELVYFSPDATEILDTIDPTKVYVIGGLVDRSIAKNQSLDRASSLGVQCVRLPLAEYYPECQHRGMIECV